jgi:hypothetical protein
MNRRPRAPGWVIDNPRAARARGVAIRATAIPEPGETGLYPERRSVVVHGPFRRGMRR